MIEAKIRALQFAKVEGELMPFSGMKEQVLISCEHRRSGDEKGKHREKRKAGLRLVGSVVILAACLLIAVSVYAVLDPVPVSNANSFMRHARIWAGNVLKLDVKVEPPEKKEVLSTAAPGESEGTAALKEFAQAHGLTVLLPTKLPDGMTLGDLKASVPDDFRAGIQYVYKDQKDTLEFTIKEVADAGGRAIFVETIEQETSVGTFIVWASATGWDAATISGSSDVYIKGTMDKDTFLTILDGLHAVY